MQDAEVYPRVCGGTLLAPDVADSLFGLSPRVRGNPGRRHHRGRRRGSIPACAGEPGWWRISAAAKRVYPRVCGGTIIDGPSCIWPGGLSPRVRGNPDSVPARGRGIGSIPACAGEPFRCRPCTPVAEVYPRVCGGTNETRLGAVGLTGLSPRVRGNPARGRASTPGLRSIPACAGEPKSYVKERQQATVYPRVCGGTLGRSDRLLFWEGLSPRVRGNLAGQDVGCDDPRSIPACAGEPTLGIPSANRPAVYPRVCGGTR